MAEIKSRVTVVETVYHRSPGAPPVGVESRFSQDLDSDEQVYERRLKATKEWQLLDCGWVEDPLMLLIINEEGKRLQVNPTDEEREDTAKRVLQIAYVIIVLGEVGGEGIPYLVPPGTSTRLYPSTIEGLHVRCQSGTAQFTLYAYPK